MHLMLQIHQARQFLEMQKADTYSGILNHLSNDISPEIMEKIARQYQFVCDPHHNPTVKDRINFIYVNVVLSHIKLQSRYILPHQKLVYLLCQVVHQQTPLNDILPLYFIAVVLLWPQQHHPECKNVGRYISQMRNSYHTVMKEVYNGKRPIVHFFLGKKQGYGQLVHFREIKRCIVGWDEQFASLWENGKIWKENKVDKLLCRVTGQVEVIPVFPSELRGHAQGSKVSFFIGFTMRGPLALDIN
ncbi:sterile alpha motif domain-containing protein 9-like [Pempheris klunzingeri]|uniref:sterile alpha motif domain-containing protein 9-like n=1 Tax=Pempheris klunzingeri TaxID=3127111 RepID=UPI003980F8C4